MMRAKVQARFNEAVADPQTGIVPVKTTMQKYKLSHAQTRAAIADAVKRAKREGRYAAFKKARRYDRIMAKLRRCEIRHPGLLVSVVTESRRKAGAAHNVSGNYAQLVLTQLTEAAAMCDMTPLVVAKRLNPKSKQPMPPMTRADLPTY